MIEVTADQYQKTIVALGETVKFIEKNPSSPHAVFCKKHSEKLCNLLENFKIVNAQSASQRLAAANRVYEFMSA